MRLRGVEALLHELQLSHLKAAALALSMQTSSRPGRCGTIVGSLVQVADSLGEIASILRSVLEQSARAAKAKDSLDSPHEFSSRLREATRESCRSTAELRTSLACLAEDRLAADRGESTRNLYLSFGGMLDLTPRLQHSLFDPAPEGAFRTVGESLTRELFAVWESGDERAGLSIDCEIAISK